MGMFVTLGMLIKLAAMNNRIKMHASHFDVLDDTHSHALKTSFKAFDRVHQADLKASESLTKVNILLDQSEKIAP